MGFIFHHEEEWQLVGYGMRAVIVGKFSEGDVLCYNPLSSSFHFTFHSYSLSTYLER